jgi:hypothetical protein
MENTDVLISRWRFQVKSSLVFVVDEHPSFCGNAIMDYHMLCCQAIF